mgnify:CR=1 FL=1
MNTRRHPRTLTEAFGPYTSDDLQPMHEPREYSARWWIAITIVGIFTLAVILTT